MGGTGRREVSADPARHRDRHRRRGRDLSLFQAVAPEPVAALPATAGCATFRRHRHRPPQTGGTLISGGTGLGWPGGTKQNGPHSYTNGASAGNVRTVGWH